MTHITVQDMYKRDEAMWYMFTRCGWSMKEIADIFRMSKVGVYKILQRCATRKNEEIEEYENLQ